MRAYFFDEPEHAALRALLLEGDQPIVTSEITRVELASAVRSAASSARVRRWRGLLARIEANFGEDGPITLLALHPERILPVAHALVIDHRLRTLDALHLAVAIEECPSLSGDGEFTFITRDDDQAEAARAVGLAVS